MERIWLTLILGIACCSIYVSGQACSPTTDTFETNIGVTRAAGTARGTLTLDDCTTLCTTDSRATCAAFIWMGTGATRVCTTFTQTEVGANSLTGAAMTNHYGRLACDRACNPTTDTFTANAGMALSGTTTATMESFSNCKARCTSASRTACAAFEWRGTAGDTTKECRIFTQAAVNAVSLGVDATSDHYARLPCAEVCTPTSGDIFTVNSGQGRNGGVDRGLQTLTACRSLCTGVSITDCAAFDWRGTGTTTKTCYIFTQAAVNANALMAIANNEHYTRVQCNQVCTSSSGDIFTGMAGQGRNGGVDRGQQTLAACRTLCTDVSIRDCAAFDWRGMGATTRTCLTFTRAAVDANALMVLTDNDHYTRLECSLPVCNGPADDTFTTTTGQGRNGGTDQGMRTLADCRSLCTGASRTDCAAFDWRGTGATMKNCLIFTQAVVDANALMTIANNNHYTRVPCSPGACADDYTKFENMGRRNGVDRGRQTLDGCKAYCNMQSRTECVGFDFAGSSSNPSDPMRNCWTFNKETADNNELMDRTGELLDHYERRPCDTACTDTYTAEEGKGRHGGVDQGVKTKDECIAFCNALTRTECAGFDWSSNTVGATTRNCWTFTKEAIDNNELTDRSNEVIEHNTRIACVTGTTMKPGCTDTYNEFVNEGRQGASSIGTFTLDQCKGKCNELTRVMCAAFDWATDPGNANSNTRECWIFTKEIFDANQRVMRTDRAISHFERVDCVEDLTTDACPDEFRKITNTNFVGGTPLGTDINDVAKCQAHCRAQTLCTGIDFNRNSNRCWWHTQSAYDQPNSNANVDHYRKEPCAVTGVTGCMDTYTEMRGMQLFGGSARPEFDNNMGACEAACSGQAFCTAYELDATDKCFLHTNNTDPPRSNPSNNHRLYIRSNLCQTTPRRGCVDSFQSFPNVFIYDGKEQSSINDNDACADACRVAVPVCFGYDFDTSNRCFFHDANTIGDTRNQGPTVTHYVRQFTCNATGCVSTYTESVNMNRNGGTRQDSINTRADCEAACSNTQQGDANTCHGYDFNSNNDQCWFHIGSIPSQLNSLTGVNSYERNFNCPNACLETYTETKDMNRAGGIRQSNIDTKDECQTACSNTAQDANGCYGYDYTSSNQCWFHIGSIPTQTNSLTGVNTYQRNFNCDGDTTTGAGACREEFKEYENSNALGAVKQTNINTEPACRTACLASTEGAANYCYAYDFDGDCWLHQTEDYNLNEGGAQGVTHYKRQRTCPGTQVGGCVEQYEIMENRNAARGRDVGMQTVEGCQTLCNAQTNCYGFDIGSGRCWIQEQTRDYVLGVSNGVTNYRRRFNCGAESTTMVGPVCRPTFRQEVNTIVYGAQPSAGRNTVEQCQAACTASADCVAFNFDKTTAVDKCWLIEGQIPTQTPNNDLDLYIRENNCANGTTQRGPSSQCTMVAAGRGNILGGTFVSGVSTEEGCKMHCLNTESCKAIDYDGTASHCFSFESTGTATNNKECCRHFNKECGEVCVESYTKNDNRRYHGGEDVPGSNTVMACQMSCTSRDTCAGFDFNHDINRCYLHVSANINNPITDDDVDFYQRVPCVEKTTVPVTQRTTLCPSRYEEFQNSNAQRGTLDSSSNTLQECQDACNKNANCTAVDYVESSSQCFIHTGTPTINPNAQGVNHYQKVPCQPTPAPRACNIDITFLVDTSNRQLRSTMIDVMTQIVQGIRIGGTDAQVAIRVFGNSNFRLLPYDGNRAIILNSVRSIVDLQPPANMPSAITEYFNNEHRASLTAGRQSFLVILSDFEVVARHQTAFSQLSTQLGQVQTILIVFINPLNNQIHGYFTNPSYILHSAADSTAASAITALGCRI